MKLPAWKALRWALLPLLLLGGAGCSGINASKSVSPLDFILPGLMQADPLPAPTTPGPLEPEPAKQLAQVR